MPQRLALQINEGRLPRRMHHLEDEGISVNRSQLEVVIVFARQRPRGGLKAIECARQTNGFCFGHWLSYAGLQQHASNLTKHPARMFVLPALSFSGRLAGRVRSMLSVSRMLLRDMLRIPDSGRFYGAKDFSSSDF